MFQPSSLFVSPEKRRALTKASYKPEGSRANLCEQPIFGAAFIEAKRRVAKMDIRYVEEAEPIKQALLEIYVATALGTRYNDFENH
jgi:hypothetical protein